MVFLFLSEYVTSEVKEILFSCFLGFLLKISKSNASTFFPVVRNVCINMYIIGNVCYHT